MSGVRSIDGSMDELKITAAKKWNYLLLLDKSHSEITIQKRNLYYVFSINLKKNFGFYLKKKLTQSYKQGKSIALDNPRK
ncbi:hypothetical protein BpHYR1_023666 [Brachionus plicatilis]|uniref:Uncharacterized protein n=1 Tax=Brachionus plicatilis TaxID=10195 RepID=A0A3M7RB28_BRAPC|nr:hypothetical protein BpHYR1_023666 [Brachionus plicatilis]